MGRPKINDGLNAHQRYYRKLKATGRCTQCRRKLRGKLKDRCRKCRKKDAARARKRHALHPYQQLPRTPNLCEKCGAHLLTLSYLRICGACKPIWCERCNYANRKVEGKTRCRGCLDKAAQNSAKRFKARKALGLCTRCDRPARPGRRSCEIHCCPGSSANKAVLLTARIAKHERRIARYQSEFQTKTSKHERWIIRYQSEFQAKTSKYERWIDKYRAALAALEKKVGPPADFP